MILALFALTFAFSPTPNQTTAGDIPLGDWKGQSVCQVKPSGCHDEESLYHVRVSPSKADAFEMQADKIVDGSPVTMGTSPCDYDTEKHLLKCMLPNGAAVELKVRGNDMQGTMTMKDGTLWRKIELRKQMRGQQ